MASASALGDLLRHWRGARGKSQLDLALDAGISQRHVSFIETGRSAPSRHTLLHLATILDVPLRERNALLLAAGFAPSYPDIPWDAPEMRVITRALTRMLRQHEPFPAIVMDRYWNVLLTNDATPKFFGRFIDLSRHPRPRNLLRLLFDPDALRPHIRNWGDLAPSLLARIRRESVGGIDDTMRALISPLGAYEAVKSRPDVDTSASLPVIPIAVERDGIVLNYFSMVTTVGSPNMVAAQELRVECMFPADDATEAQHARLMRLASLEDGAATRA